MEKPRIIIIGATSAIAEQCARRWLSRPADLLLVGRDEAKLARVAGDLAVRSPASRIECAVVDFLDPSAIRSLVEGFASEGAIDIALVAHGTLPDQLQCQQDLAACREAIAINSISPALFLEALAGRMAAAGSGRLAVIGSVAGDRGRRSNYVYGAAKSLLEGYAQGLQHRFAGSGPTVSLIKPGPTRTPMTAGLEESGMRLAPVEAVAERIVRGVGRGRPVIYAPGKWALIMMVIRHLPRFVFNRLDI
jgi:short-subunit dehydrogenase